MNRRLDVLLFAAVFAAVGCGSDDATPGGGSSSSSESSTSSTPTTTTETTTTVTTVGSGSSTSTTADPVTSTTDPSTTSTTAIGCEEPETTGNAETGTMGFEFRDTSYCDYAQVDRVGWPLVTTLLIASVDDYNAATPADDRMFAFFAEINAALMDLHPELDAEIMGLGLTPCDFGTCNDQLNDFIAPDVLTLDPMGPDAFPNGRRLEEPALDLMLAPMLLDLSVDPIDALANLPLGPPAGDVAPLAVWPYVAAPQ